MMMFSDSTPPSMRHSQTKDILFPEDEQPLNAPSSPSIIDSYNPCPPEVKRKLDQEYMYSLPPDPQYNGYSVSSSYPNQYLQCDKQYSPRDKQYSPRDKQYSPRDNNNFPPKSAMVSPESQDFRIDASWSSNVKPEHNNNTWQPVTHPVNLNRSLDSFPSMLNIAKTSNHAYPPYIDDMSSTTKRSSLQLGPPSRAPPPYPGHSQYTTHKMSRCPAQAQNQHSPAAVSSNGNTNNYAVVRRHEHSPRRSANNALRRKTWSPASFEKIHQQGNRLTLRTFSIEQLDVASADDAQHVGNPHWGSVTANQVKRIDMTPQYEESLKPRNEDVTNESTLTANETESEAEIVYGDMEFGSPRAPPKIAPVSGQMEKSQTGHKMLIKPIALKPVPADHTPVRYPTSSYSPRNQQALRRTSPQTYNDVMKATPYSNSHDDGYISQECHSRTNSSNSSLQKPLRQTAQVMSAQNSPKLHSQESHSRTSSNNGSLQRPSRQAAQVLSPAQNSPKPHSQDTPKVTYLTDSGQKMVSSVSSSHSDSGRPESLNSLSNLSRRVSRDSLQQPSAMMDSSYTHTPSPSDSSLNELEGMVRDKDAQIRQLRETMERNETAILQVCEEKEQNWEMRFHELRSDWEKKLRLQQQKAFKMEQALLMQLFKLQQERKSTRSEIETLRTEKERAERHATGLQDDVKVARTKLEEAQWDMCQKVGEISHLKVRSKESKENLSQKSSEVLSLKAQIKDIQRDNGEKNTEILGLETELKKSREGLKDMQRTLDNMQRQLSKYDPSTKVHDKDVSPIANDASTSQEATYLQQELAKRKVDYEADKDRWLAEKEKVIRYQRHLQLNYVQMANKNKMLEAEVQQLTLELEGRDLCLEGTKIEGEGEESIC